MIDEARVRKHKKTTTEIVECCKDVKVLGIKELWLLKKWREALRVDFEEVFKKAADAEKDLSLSRSILVVNVCQKAYK